MDDDRRSWRRGLVPTLRIVAVAYLSAAGSLLFWSHAPAVLGWQPRVVISGSMLPSIRPGDVALIASAEPGRATLPPGRIVLIRDPSRSTGFYLHRVRRYDAAGNIVTKGDANDVEDYPAVQPSQVAGQMRLLVPYVGLPMLWWQQHLWFRLAVLAGCSWCSLLLALGGRRRR